MKKAQGARFKAQIREPSLPYRFYNLIFILLLCSLLIIAFFKSSISSVQGSKAVPVETDKDVAFAGELTLSLDRNSAMIGSIVILDLKYRLPEGGTLPPKMEIKGIGGYTIIDQSASPNLIRFKLLVDRIDTWKIGPISFNYLDKTKRPQALIADPVSLNIISNLGGKPAEAQLRPAQDIISSKTIWQKYIPWVAGSIALLSFIGALIWWYKKRKVRNMNLAIQEPPHVRAKKEIDQLGSGALFEKGSVKEFYFSLTEIMKRYLEAIRSFPAAEFTTEEISHHIQKEEDRKILQLLRRADLIKFADSVPTTTGKETDIQAALSYIRATEPVTTNDHGIKTGKEKKS